MNALLKDRLALIFGLNTVVFVALAIAGAVSAYSPVPYWDMWNGYLEFYTKVSAGDWGAWWAQHNEHRIVLARLFFWMDLAWFQGAGWFLLVVNYLLLALVCLCFWQAWREQTNGENRFIGLFLLAWLFSWGQENNLTWGFQSQFILAQLLPFAAFYFLHHSASRIESGNRDFSIATLLGLLAVGSMANGVLALPLMTVYTILARMGWKRALALAVLSMASLWLYFHDYNFPGTQSLLTTLRKNPQGLMHYVLLYLGGPFTYLFGQGATGKTVATCAGVFLLISSAAFAWRTIPTARQTTLPLALLAFILYVGGTAFATAGARLTLGLDQALSSRYMTPTLMTWAALLLLYVPILESLNKRAGGKLWLPFLLLLLLMLPLQWKALKSRQDALLEYKVAALALELGIKDQVQIGNIFPSAEWALALAEAPVAQNLSIFGSPELRNMRTAMDKTAGKMAAASRCQGGIDEVQAVEGNPRYLRVRGWGAASQHHAVPSTAHILDSQGRLKGIVLSGAEVKKPRIPGGKAVELKGYVLSDAQGQSVQLIAPQSGCGFTARLPVSLFSLKKMLPEPASATVSLRQVQAGSEWNGKDSQRSNFAGMMVMGSFVNSDADTGSLQLKLKRGDKLFYRSGPVGGGQIVELPKTPVLTALLPVATDWMQLDFSSNQLPAEFELRFQDKSAAWGSWSAIAIRSN